MEGGYAAYQKFNDVGGPEYVSHAAQSTMAGAAYVGNAIYDATSYLGGSWWGSAQ